MSTNYISQITASNGTTYDIQEGVTTRLFRATCSTAADTAAKVATLDDATGYSLAAGVRVAVTFTYGNSANTPTLNVNSGGAKTIVIPTTTISTNYSSDKSYTSWGQYETIIFTYNGTYWITSGSSYILYKATSTKTSLSDYTNGTNVSYYIPFTNLSGSNYTLTSAYVSPNFKIVDSQTNHLATLNLGNDLGSDETTYRRGALRLYSQTGKYVELETKDTLSTNGIIYFPDYINNNATIATTEDIPSITLNGNSTTSPSFYAPTSAGTSGYYLKSSGSGAAPTWANFPTIPTKTSDLTNNSGFITTTKSGAYDTLTVGTGTYTGQIKIKKDVNDVTFYTTLDVSHTTNRTLTLPNKTGTIALTSDIPTKTSDLTNDSGFITTDTKNTAGSTNSTSKLYLIGATSQAANPQTYSNSNLYFSDGLKSAASAGNGTIIADISQSYNSIRLSYTDDNTYQSFLINSSGINITGNLNLYASNSASNYIKLVSSASTSNKTITFPDKSGTVALTSDIPTETTISGWGFTKNTGTLTGVTFAGTSMTVSNGVASITQANAKTALGLATVATSGSYNDLSNKPTIPTVPSNIVNTITTTAGTHTAISNKTGSVSFNVPTKTSHLTNDSGFLTSHQDISGKADKATTLAGYGITDAYTKTQVNGLVSGVLHYKGTKATVSALPTSGNTTGDVWHVTADGSEWAWDGSVWQELGTAIDLSGYAQLAGASFTGPVTFGDSVTADELETGDLIVTGAASFTNNIAVNTINGIAVGSSPKFTDSEVSTLTLTSGSTAGTSLSFGSKYTLTAGSKTVSFTMPSSPTVPTITLNGNATTSPSFYAPTSAGTSGYVLKSNGSGAPSWGSAILTDKKLEVAEVTSGGATYHPIVGTGTSASTRQYDSTGFSYSTTSGTSSTIGYANLILGNDISSGTAGNKFGEITVYGRNNKCITFQMADVVTSTNCYLPNKAGTIALTSDIPDDNYFLNLVYPVGAIYISTVSTSPENLFGGTWVQIQDTFLLAAGSTYAAGATGGEATHKLTAAESGVPAHGHGFTQPKVAIGTHQHTPYTGSTTDEYFVTSADTSANNTRVTYSSSGNRWVDGMTAQSTFHHRVATTAADLGTKTATGGAVQNNTAANATNAHNNMPPYLAVYVWKRTA